MKHVEKEEDEPLTMEEQVFHSKPVFHWSTL